MAKRGFVILTFTFRQDGRTWLGRCNELSTSTYGRSIARVRDELAELTSLHLNALEESGERERFFRENQIKFYSDDQDEGAITSPIGLIDQAEFVQHFRIPVEA